MRGLDHFSKILRKGALIWQLTKKKTPQVCQDAETKTGLVVNGQNKSHYLYVRVCKCV